jgi:hypothetical protein
LVGEEVGMVLHEELTEKGKLLLSLLHSRLSVGVLDLTSFSSDYFN